VPAKAGDHTLCLTFTNVGAGSAATPLCRTVRIAHNPLGRVDLISVSNRTVSVTGWTLDRDTMAPITIAVRVDAAPVGTSSASILRADIARAFPVYGGNHGFRFTPSRLLTMGTHNVCVQAINVGAGTADPFLGCRTLTVV
jgi:hypothetical protein